VVAEYCPGAQVEQLVEPSCKPSPWGHFGIEHLIAPQRFMSSKAVLVFQASAIKRLVQSDSAFPPFGNAWKRLTAPTSHELSPPPVNLDAPLNVLAIVVTLPTFHELRSEFISVA